MDFFAHTFHGVSLGSRCVEMAKQTNLFCLSLRLLLLSHGHDSSGTRFAAHGQASALRLTLLVLCLSLRRTALLCCLSTFLCITTFGALGGCLWCRSCLTELSHTIGLFLLTSCCFLCLLLFLQLGARELLFSSCCSVILLSSLLLLCLVLFRCACCFLCIPVLSRCAYGLLSLSCC